MLNETEAGSRTKYVRKRTDEAICRFRNDLSEQDWKEVNVGEVNAAYEAFLDKYLTLYEKYCPYVQYRYTVIALVKPLGLQGDYRMHTRRRINFIEILLNLGQKMHK